MENYISQNKLIEELSKSNIIANECLLISWRARGAIPHRKRGLGRNKGGKGGKGSVTEYPATVTQQIQRLEELLHEKRSLDWAIYQLWREGYPVNLHKVLKRDLRKIEGWRSVLSSEAAWHDGEGESGGTIRKEGQKRLPRGGLLDRFRRAIGKEDFILWIETSVIILIGSSYYPTKNIGAFTKSLPIRLDRAEITVALTHATFLMSPEHLEDILNKARDTDFPIAYNFLETFADVLRVNIPLLRDIPPVSEWNSTVLSFALLLYLSFFADQDLLEAVSPVEI